MRGVLNRILFVIFFLVTFPITSLLFIIGCLLGILVSFLQWVLTGKSNSLDGLDFVLEWTFGIPYKIFKIDSYSDKEDY